MNRGKLGGPGKSSILWGLLRCQRRAAIFALALGIATASGVEVFVAPDGSDAAAGTLQAPFATLAHARDVVRKNSERGGEVEGASIWLRGGTYRMSQTLVMDRRDNGVRFSAWKNEIPVISGAYRPAGEWRLVEDRDDIWEITVPEEIGDVRSVFQNGKMLPRARTAGFRQLTTKPDSVPYRLRREIDETHLYLPKEALQAVNDFRGAELRVIPQFPWLMNLLPVAEVNRDSALVRTEVPSIYPLTTPAFGRFPGGTLWIENVIEAIDQEGEWMFDGGHRRLLMKSEGPPLDVEVARLTELVRIEGEINEWDYADHPVRAVGFRGVTFAQAKRYAWPPDKTGWGLQHDWELYDQPTAMVRLRFAEQCVFDECRFIDSGAAGLRMDLHAMGNMVRRCEFRDIGGVGVLLAGYGMGWKDVNSDNEVSDSSFVRIGVEWWASPAVMVWQSGANRIVHNEFRELPYTGIVVSGRTQLNVTGLKESSRTARWDEVINHLESGDRSWQAREPLMHGRNNDIGWNDISAVMQVMADGNAIYVSGTGGGNRLHHNFIHDIDSANINASIRTDDDQYEVLIEDNVIARSTGEGIVLKGINNVSHNLVYDLRARTNEGTNALFQRGYLVLSGEPVTGASIERNAFVSLAARQIPLMERKEPWRKHGKLMPPVTLTSASSANNLWWCAVDPAWGEEFVADQQKAGAETGSISLNPLLADPEGDVFRIREDAPASVRAAIGDGWDVRDAGPRR